MSGPGHDCGEGISAHPIWDFGALAFIGTGAGVSRKLIEPARGWPPKSPDS